MEKERIVFDLDDTLVVGNFLEIANECFNDNKTFEDIKSYYVEDNFNITTKQREKYLDELVVRDVYENAKIISGAYDSLKKLVNNEKYDVLIYSACVLKNRESYSGQAFARKFDFIFKNFDFINPQNIILGGNKSIICAKYFIDDRLDHLINSKAEYKILFTAYHNKDITQEELEKNNIVRLDNHDELYKFIITH